MRKRVKAKQIKENKHYHWLALIEWLVVRDHRVSVRHRRKKLSLSYALIIIIISNSFNPHSSLFSERRASRIGLFQPTKRLCLWALARIPSATPHNQSHSVVEYYIAKYNKESLGPQGVRRIVRPVFMTLRIMFFKLSRSSQPSYWSHDQTPSLCLHVCTLILHYYLCLINQAMGNIWILGKRVSISSPALNLCMYSVLRQRIN